MIYGVSELEALWAQDAEEGKRSGGGTWDETDVDTRMAEEGHEMGQTPEVLGEREKRGF